MIEEVIYSLLSGSAPLAALVGSRIYPVLMPEVPDPGSLYPAVTYQTIHADEVHTLDRTGGLNHNMMQINVWSNPNDYDTIKKIAHTIRTTLEAAYGIFSTSDGQITLAGVLRESERDGYEEKTRTMHNSQDFLVLFNE